MFCLVLKKIDKLYIIGMLII